MAAIKGMKLLRSFSVAESLFAPFRFCSLMVLELDGRSRRRIAGNLYFLELEKTCVNSGAGPRVATLFPTKGHYHLRKRQGASLEKIHGYHYALIDGHRLHNV